MTTKCYKCNQTIKNEELIKTDEFKEYGAEIQNYCPSCFLENVKSGFGNYDVGNCEICNSALVLEHNDSEIILQAQEDYTVSFICAKFKKALDRNNDVEIQKLEDEGHDGIMLYTIQPNPNESDFG